MENCTMIRFDRAKLNALKRAYAKADKDIFIFDGHEILKDYAKYMIQYLELKFKGEPVDETESGVPKGG